MSKRSRSFLLVVIVLAGIIAIVFLLLSKRTKAPETFYDRHMTITSPSFLHSASIPKQFTCDGENINPELRISGVSQNAKSVALIVDDPDAPRGTFTHWLLWNIGPQISSIAENSVPSGTVQGQNDAGRIGYIGPCPPSGTHRYFFKLYALDAALNLPSGAEKSSLEAEINAHLLGKAELIALYQR